MAASTLSDLTRAQALAFTRRECRKAPGVEMAASLFSKSLFEQVRLHASNRAQRPLGGTVKGMVFAAPSVIRRSR